MRKEKKSEVNKMKGIRYREIEKYKEYPAVYNTLLWIVDRSQNIENIDLVVMEKSKEYEMEERNKKVRDMISEILGTESSIEKIKQDRNTAMEATKANILYVLSQIQEKGNTLINDIGKNKDDIEEIVQIFEKMINSIPQNISINVKQRMDRVKFIYRREGQSGYKYNDTIDLLKKEGKQIIDC